MGMLAPFGNFIECFHVASNVVNRNLVRKLGFEMVVAVGLEPTTSRM
jgi:hypothetical protein